jgi:hypothetical protein
VSAHAPSCNQDSTSPRERAQTLLDRKLAPIPVPFKRKEPNRTGWPDLRITAETAKDYFNGRPQNIGVLNGEPSDWQVCVDKDTPEAVALGSKWLPHTAMRHGRPSSSESHQWYRAKDAVTRRFDDPAPPPGAKARILELLSTGTQTIMPGSTHPSGEVYTWDADGAPTEITADRLAHLTAVVAAGALIARHWPTEGSRQDAALALAGGLLRGGWDAHRTRRFIHDVAEAAGDDEAAKRADAVKFTEKRLNTNKQSTGWPRLTKYIDQRVVDTVRDWLEITPESGLRLEVPPAVPAAIPAGFTAAELQQRAFAPVQFAIPDVLPEGLTLLAGKPKLGKSWLALGWAVALASGGRALGKIAVTAGEVLYLALEDNPRRLHTRLAEMLHADPWPAGLHLRTEWPRLDAGGLAALDVFVDTHPAVRTILIDTFKQVKPKSGRGTLYAEDYDSLAPLHAWALKRGLTVVVVTHARKADADDVTDTISSTTGFTAVADTLMILQRSRGARGAVLNVISRDLEQDLALNLTWDGWSKQWVLPDDVIEFTMTPERLQIRKILQTWGEQGPREIAEKLDVPANRVRVMLYAMKQAGQVYERDGRYGMQGREGALSSNSPPPPNAPNGANAPNAPNAPNGVWGGAGRSDGLGDANAPNAPANASAPDHGGADLAPGRSEAISDAISDVCTSANAPANGKTGLEPNAGAKSAPSISAIRGISANGVAGGADTPRGPQPADYAAMHPCAGCGKLISPTWECCVSCETREQAKGVGDSGDGGQAGGAA